MSLRSKSIALVAGIVFRTRKAVPPTKKAAVKTAKVTKDTTIKVAKATNEFRKDLGHALKDAWNKPLD